MERYLRVNLLGMCSRLMKNELPGRGLTKVEKHCFRCPRMENEDKNQRGKKGKKKDLKR